MGERKDISNIMYALDVYCLSSKSEGFPNVVAEAMLMQTPCVVTDVGDAKRIVGSLGKVVPSNNASELANALLEMERLDTHELRKIGRASREKILETYNIEVIAQQYSRLYEAVIKNELS
jgi:glycosyltransferase involved in cell wall biosynthesis